MAFFMMSFLVITFAILGMALGALCGRRPLKGGCGGLNSLAGLEAACESCASRCKKEQHVQDAAHADMAVSS